MQSPTRKSAINFLSNSSSLSNPQYLLMPSTQMSSQLERTSAILGEYMLKGWTLTDLHCDTCHSTTLMREPILSARTANRTPIQFCAACDGGPNSSLASTSSHANQTPASTASPSSQPNLRSTSTSPSIQIPTMGSVPSGPHQSDQAATLISQLLLQGYSLLNDNCLNPQCTGIPLVGYPRKQDGAKDSRRMCVTCGGRWVSEGDLKGMTVLKSSVVGGGGTGAGKGKDVIADANIEEEDVDVDVTTVESPRSRKRRELYAEGERIVAEQQREKERLKILERREVQDGKDTSVEMEEDEEMDAQEDDVVLSTDLGSRAEADFTSLHPALTQTSKSLTKTLIRLSNSLDLHTERLKEDQAAQARYFVDVKLHTEAIKDVLEVLKLVKGFR